MPTIDFNPRFPRGKRPIAESSLVFRAFNFNPRFPRGKRPHDKRHPGTRTCISIHASRGGSDSFSATRRYSPGYFNPRFPRGKRLLIIRAHTFVAYFNPRFPRGKRLK